MNNKKAQITLAVTLGMIIVIAVLIFLIFGGAIMFLGLNKFQIAGVAIVILGFVFAIKPAMMGKGSLDNKKIALILIVFLFGGGLFVLPYMGLLSNTQYMSGYFESPFFATISCDPATGVKSVSGIINLNADWTSVTCPENTKECDFLISFPSRSSLTTQKWAEYQTCMRGTSDCSSINVYPTNKNFPTSGITDQLLLSNMPANKELRIKFKEGCISNLVSGCTSGIAGTLRTQYISYVLWVQDSLNGGKNQLSDSHDCYLPDNNVNLLNNYIVSSNVKDTIGKIADTDGQSIVIRGYLQPSETYNYISGTVTRALTGNTLTFQGQTAYCQEQVQGTSTAAIYKIGTIETGTYKYNIVDKNTVLATPPCCNEGEVRLNQVCTRSGDTFSWQAIQIEQETGKTNVVCSLTKPCNDGRLSLSSKQSFVYKCISGYCVISDIQNEECTLSTDCKTDEECINFKCQVTSTQQDAQPSDQEQSTDGDASLNCGVFEYQTTENQITKNWYNYIGIGTPTITPVPVCKVKPTYMLVIIAAGVILVIVIIVLLLKKPTKRRKK